MNTDNNIYTIVYTTIVVVLVAAVLALVSQKLGPMQVANEKAETISQILTAAGFGDKNHWQEQGNAATLKFYRENIESSDLYDTTGGYVGALDFSRCEIYSTSELKAQDYAIRGKGGMPVLPVYRFSNGKVVIPVYGAGLWGPIWGYIALEEDLRTIAGAYFDHASETPGLGGKIKDDPAFRGQFAGRSIDFTDKSAPFHIVKGGAPEGKANAIDAITGATMTSRGLDAAITTWLNAYGKSLEVKEAPADSASVSNTTEEEQLWEN